MKNISYTPGKALSEAEGFSIIEAYLNSGMSSADFYKGIGMSEKTFYKWRKRYMEYQSAVGESSSTSGRLLPIEVLHTVRSQDRDPLANPEAGYAYEVEFASGIRVRMQSASHAERLLYICNELK